MDHPNTRARARWGAPVHSIGAPLPTGVVIRVDAFEADGRWLFVSEGVGRAVRRPWELSLLLDRADDAELPAFPAQMFQSLTHYMMATGNIFGPGHRMPLGEPLAPDSAIRALYFCEDPDAQDTDLLRVVGITHDERIFTDSVPGEVFQSQVLGALPDLATDLTRASLLTPERRAAIQAMDVQRDTLLHLEPELAWTDEGSVAVLTLSTTAIESLAQATASTSIILKGPTQQVRLSASAEAGSPTYRTDEHGIVHVTLPAGALTALTPGSNALGPLTIEVVSPAGREAVTAELTPAEGVVATARPHPPSLPRPREHVYAFAYKLLPMLLAREKEQSSFIERLDVENGGGAWLRTKWRQLSVRGHASVAHTGVGPRPGFGGEETLRLDVISEERIGDSRVVWVQMPPAIGAAEPHYLAIELAPDMALVWSWEMTASGLAKLGVWMHTGDEVEYEHADGDAFPVLQVFQTEVRREIETGGPLAQVARDAVEYASLVRAAHQAAEASAAEVALAKVAALAADREARREELDATALDDYERRKRQRRIGQVVAVVAVVAVIALLAVVFMWASGLR